MKFWIFHNTFYSPLYWVEKCSPYPLKNLGLLKNLRGFLRWLSVKESACQAVDMGSIPGSGRTPRGGNGNSLQYSCLENPMNWGARWTTIHGVAKSWIWLSDQTTTIKNLRMWPYLEIRFLQLVKMMSSWIMEKEMETHSSTLAWRVLWTEEPGGLLSMGLHRVGRDWSDLATAAASWSRMRPKFNGSRPYKKATWRQMRRQKADRRARRRWTQGC